jgi:hypothetical protein
VGKHTKIGERVKVGFTADFFNVFNHVNFVDPVLNLNNRANFGVITTQLIDAGFRPRAIQFGLRVDF